MASPRTETQPIAELADTSIAPEALAQLRRPAVLPPHITKKGDADGGRNL